MRLLNVKTEKLEEFFNNIPPYSILSHTWEDEEVTFQHLNAGGYQGMVGYEKIRECCRVSRAEGYEYTWIDTCCINKSSSAELSEAINSMFRWYNESAICYAYLGDLSGRPGDENFETDISASKWFTRGWTLQELIAPPIVVILNKGWVEIGTKSSLSRIISRITRIHEPAFNPTLGGPMINTSLQKYSIAQRMSWAAWRKTTRLEDQAYCLMGLFNVNMPLLYGEGKRAFFRLQQEIMNTSDDCTIFAWEVDPVSGPFSRLPFSMSLNPAEVAETCGLLASSPNAFCGCGNVTIRRPPLMENTNILQVPQIPSFTHTYVVSKGTLQLRANYLNFNFKTLMPSDVLFNLHCGSHVGRKAESLDTVLRRTYVPLRYSEIGVVFLDCENSRGQVCLLLQSMRNGKMTRSQLIKGLWASDFPNREMFLTTEIYCELQCSQIESVEDSNSYLINLIDPSKYECLALMESKFAAPLHAPIQKFLLYGNINQFIFRGASELWPSILFTCRLGYGSTAYAGYMLTGEITLDRPWTANEPWLWEHGIPMQASTDTSEIRGPLGHGKEFVVKLRAKSDQCTFITSIE